MRDDLSAPNLGQADRGYKAEFFWQSYRSIEQWMTRVLTKGPINATTLTADAVVADTITATNANISNAVIDVATIGTIAAASTGTTLLLTSEVDASLASTGHGLQIGPTAGVNLAIDNNEIVARNNGASSPFSINADGGLVTVGSGGITSAGPITGNVTGNLTGNVTGNVAGNVAGSIVSGSTVEAGYVEIANTGTAYLRLKDTGQTGNTVTAGLDMVGFDDAARMWMGTDGTTGAGYLTSYTGDLVLTATGGEVRIGSQIVRPSRWETIVIAEVPNGTASVNFTNLSAYRQLRCTGSLFVNTTGAQPLLRTSSNNGSSYDAGATDYYWRYHVVTTAGGATARVDTSYFGILAALGQATGWSIIFDFQIEDWNDPAGARSHIQAWSHWLATDGNPASGHNSGARNAATSMNAFQLICSSGTYSRGYCHLMGVRR